MRKGALQIRILARSLLFRAILFWIGIRVTALIASAVLGAGLTSPANAPLSVSAVVVFLVVALLIVDTWRANEWTLLANLGIGPIPVALASALAATSIETLAVVSMSALV